MQISDSARLLFEKYPGYEPVGYAGWECLFVDVDNLPLSTLIDGFATIEIRYNANLQPIQQQLDHLVNERLKEAWNYPDEIRSKLMDEFGSDVTTYIGLVDNEYQFRTSFDPLDDNFEVYIDHDVLSVETNDGLQRFLGILNQDEIEESKIYQMNSDEYKQAKLQPSEERPYKVIIRTIEETLYKVFSSIDECKQEINELKNNYDRLDTFAGFRHDQHPV
jgi:hypothetical protein